MPSLITRIRLQSVQNWCENRADETYTALISLYGIITGYLSGEPRCNRMQPGACGKGFPSLLIRIFSS